MLEKYKTVYEGGEGEIVEKKSRFIATVRPVQTEEEALAFIEEMKKKYWDARHNCYVYSVGKNREYTRCSDDGEPSGTAGRPMLDVILGEDIYNVAAVAGLRHLREIKITINRRNAGFFMSNFIYFYVVRSCILSLYVI